MIRALGAAGVRAPISEIAALRAALAQQRWDWWLLLAGLIVLDVIMLGVATLVAALLREHLDGVLVPDGLTATEHLVGAALAFPLILLLFWTRSLYDRDQILAGTREYAHVAHAMTYGVLLGLTASYITGHAQLVSRAWLLLMWVLGIGCVSLGRFVARRVVRVMRRSGWLRTRVIIVGASTFGVAIAEQLRAATSEGLDVLGFLDEYLPLGQRLVDEIAVVGRPADLLRRQAGELADEFVLVPQALPHQRQEEISRLMASKASPTLRLAVNSSDLLTHGVRVCQRGNVPLVTVQRARLQGLESICKWTFDVVGAMLVLIVVAPLVLALLARARVAGRRPLVRSFCVAGVAGKRSRLWLLDKSVTSWPPLRGAPALLAVLTGQLSLVGPRPRPAHWVGDDALTAVKPGLTGPWRLTGPGASLAEQAVDDLTYVRNYSIWEDVRIVWESLRRLWAGRLPGLLGRWEDERSPTSAP
jgi:lipopolysaccharide/colanic/teichoic acid biosynthesis glycosyltransferase